MYKIIFVKRSHKFVNFFDNHAIISSGAKNLFHNLFTQKMYFPVKT